MSETVNTAIRDENLSAVITAQGIKVQFNGPPLSIIKNILSFFAKQYPEVDLAKKISLNYGTGYLTQKYSRFIKIESGKVEVTVRSRKPEVSSAHLTEESPLSLSEEVQLEDYIATEAGIEPKSQYQTKQPTKWSTKEFIALHLVASRIAHGLGITQIEGMKISDIESATKSNPKSIVPRLSEMLKSGYLTKDVRFESEGLPDGKQNEPTPIYSITTLGIHWLNNVVDKKQQ